MSVHGRELRQSIEAALLPPLPRRTRVEQLIDSIGIALAEGRESEGVLVGVEPYARMIEFISVLPADVPLPHLVVESENQIALDWEVGARRVLALTIDETPYIGFAALLGREPVYGRAPFAGEVPETVAFLLRRLYPAAGQRAA